MKRVVLPAVMAFAYGITSARDFNVRDFGAAGDGVAKDTAAIQRAIDAAAAAGGGNVGISPWTYLSGTIVLKSGVALVLERVAFDGVSVDCVVFCRILPNFARETRIRDIRFANVSGKVLGPSYVTGRPESPIGRVEFTGTGIPCGLYAFHADVRVDGGSPEIIPVFPETAKGWNRAISERGEYPFSLAIRGTRRGDSRYGGATRQPKDGVRAKCRSGAEILAAVRSRSFAVRLEFGTGLRLADGLSLDEALDLLPDGGVWIEIDCAEDKRDEARRTLRRRGRSHQAAVLAPETGGGRRNSDARGGGSRPAKPGRMAAGAALQNREWEGRREPPCKPGAAKVLPRTAEFWYDGGRLGTKNGATSWL